ncbi:Maguk P55 subfamily member [Cichlidogyrus casuarinus]|uniref:Maguk P55 subfamily member n=1 Tax=Cichlidogyrus casuarinus TaxID=1844966 RepID=A0ABD2Q9X2_9PLAT
MNMLNREENNRLNVKDAIQNFENELISRKAQAEEVRFLRHSLRESDRMRRLAKQQQRQPNRPLHLDGSANRGYIVDEDVKKELSDISTFLSQLRRTLRRRKADYSQGENIDPDLDEKEWSWLSNTLTNDNFFKSFFVHEYLGKAYERCRAQLHGVPKQEWPRGTNLAQLTQDVSQYCSQRSYVSDYTKELCQLLHKPLLIQFFATHDAVAEVFTQWKKDKHLLSPQNLRETSFTGDGRRKVPRPMQDLIHETAVPGCYWKSANSTANPNMRLVVIQKQPREYLGLTVVNESTSILVARVIRDSLADKTNLFFEGDELIWVNGVDLLHKDVNFVHDFLKEQSGQLEFLVTPSKEAFLAATRYHSPEPTIHLRALFSYSPDEDHFIPCKDLSLPFCKGHVLEVVSTKDPNWWQAVRLQRNERIGSYGELAGLIPSPQYQYNRSILRVKSDYENNKQEESAKHCESSSEDEYATQNGANGGLGAIADLSIVMSQLLWMKDGAVAKTVYWKRADGLEATVEDEKDLREWCRSGIVWGIHGFSVRNIRKKIKQKSSSGHLRSKHKLHLPHPLPMSNAGWLDDRNTQVKISHPFLLTYEPVEEFPPEPKRRRPLVIVGPAHLGRHLLIEALVDYDPRKFTTVEMHTTNLALSGQTVGVQRFTYMDRQEFELRYAKKEFLEIGIMNKHYYGSLKTTLEKIIDSGKVALLALRPESVRAMRNSGLMPFVLFLDAPERVMDMERVCKGLNLGTECSRTECQYALEACKLAEKNYGHWFDETLTMDGELDQAVEILLDLTLNLEREPQWVPRRWLYPQ